MQSHWTVLSSLGWAFLLMSILVESHRWRMAVSHTDTHTSVLSTMLWHRSLDPLLEGCKPLRISVLPSRQRSYLGSHFSLTAFFLPGRKENLVVCGPPGKAGGLWPARTASQHQLSRWFYVWTLQTKTPHQFCMRKISNFFHHRLLLLRFQLTAGLFFCWPGPKHWRICIWI